MNVLKMIGVMVGILLVFALLVFPNWLGKWRRRQAIFDFRTAEPLEWSSETQTDEVANPPEGSGFTIGREAGTVRIINSGDGIDWIKLGMLAFFASSIPALFVLALVIGKAEPSTAFVFPGCMSVPGAVIFWRYVKNMPRRTIFTVTKDPLLSERSDQPFITLHVSRAAIFGWRQWSWPRSTIDTILPADGLVVVSKTSRYSFLAWKARHELRWLAEQLCTLLAIDNERSAISGEIPVDYCISWDKTIKKALEDNTSLPPKTAIQGFLRARPGEMRLRYYSLTTPDFLLFEGERTGFRVWFHLIWSVVRRPYAFRIALEDSMCQINDDGIACLRIHKIWPPLVLTIWSEDKVALQSALARFWGSSEE
jgi:hypothetical protein